MKCLVDDAEVHVEVAGDWRPDAPALVLLHGACNDHSAWDAVMPALGAAGIVVYAPDFPGHGASAGPALESIEAMVDWVTRLLDACGLGACAIGGHSMGSLVALGVAARTPGRIVSLALIGTAAPMRVSPRLLEQARSDAPAAMRAVAAWSHRVRDGVTDPADEARTLARMQAVEQADPGALAIDLAACDACADALAWGAAVRVPTVFVLGQEDRMTPPRAAESLRAAMPHARTVLLPCGHALMDEEASDVARALAGSLPGAADRFMEPGT